MTASRARKSYDGVVLAVPVTVPYERYSIESAHWWLGRALRALAEGAGISHREFDGFAVASFTMGPDTAIALTQHFGLTPRWLDHMPMGVLPASSRSGARRGQCRRAMPISLPVLQPIPIKLILSERRSPISPASRRMPHILMVQAGLNASFALIARAYMDRFGAKREDFGKALRRATRQCAQLPTRADEEAADTGSISVGATDR